MCVCVCLRMSGQPSRMGESERQCGHCEEENKLLPLPGIEAFCLKPTNPWSSLYTDLRRWIPPPSSPHTELLKLYPSYDC